MADAYELRDCFEPPRIASSGKPRCGLMGHRQSAAGRVARELLAASGVALAALRGALEPAPAPWVGCGWPRAEAANGPGRRRATSAVALFAPASACGQPQCCPAKGEERFLAVGALQAAGDSLLARATAGQRLSLYGRPSVPARSRYLRVAEHRERIDSVPGGTAETADT